jgi:hypothetical protein
VWLTDESLASERETGDPEEILAELAELLQSAVDAVEDLQNLLNGTRQNPEV